MEIEPSQPASVSDQPNLKATKGFSFVPESNARNDAVASASQPERKPSSEKSAPTSEKARPERTTLPAADSSRNGLPKENRAMHALKPVSNPSAPPAPKISQVNVENVGDRNPRLRNNTSLPKKHASQPAGGSELQRKLPEKSQRGPLSSPSPVDQSKGGARKNPPETGRLPIGKQTSAPVRPPSVNGNNRNSTNEASTAKKTSSIVSNGIPLKERSADAPSSNRVKVREPPHQSREALPLPNYSETTRSTLEECIQEELKMFYDLLRPRSRAEVVKVKQLIMQMISKEIKGKLSKSATPSKLQKRPLQESRQVGAPQTSTKSDSSAMKGKGSVSESTGGAISKTVSDATAAPMRLQPRAVEANVLKARKAARVEKRLENLRKVTHTQVRGLRSLFLSWQDQIVKKEKPLADIMDCRFVELVHDALKSSDSGTISFRRENLVSLLRDFNESTFASRKLIDEYKRVVDERRSCKIERNRYRMEQDLNRMLRIFQVLYQWLAFLVKELMDEWEERVKAGTNNVAFADQILELITGNETDNSATKLIRRVTRTLESESGNLTTMRTERNSFIVKMNEMRRELFVVCRDIIKISKNAKTGGNVKRISNIPNGSGSVKSVSDSAKGSEIVKKISNAKGNTQESSPDKRNGAESSTIMKDVMKDYEKLQRLKEEKGKQSNVQESNQGVTPNGAGHARASVPKLLKRNSRDGDSGARGRSTPSAVESSSRNRSGPTPVITIDDDNPSSEKRDLSRLAPTLQPSGTERKKRAVSFSKNLVVGAKEQNLSRKEVQSLFGDGYDLLGDGIALQQTAVEERAGQLSRGAVGSFAGFIRAYIDALLNGGNPAFTRPDDVTMMFPPSAMEEILRIHKEGRK